VKKILVALLVGSLAFPLSSATAVTVPSGIIISEVSCAQDFVEILNTSNKTVLIGGMVITDKKVNETDPTHRYTVPSRITMKPNARLVFRPGQNGLPFGVKCGDDRIRLGFKTSKWIQLYEVSVANHTDTVSWGLLPNGRWAANKPTPGKANSKAPSGIAIDRAAWLFKPTAPYDILLTVSNTNMNRLRQVSVQNPLRDYVEAEFQIRRADDSLVPAIPMVVGLRPKIGYGSFRGIDFKAGLKVKFNEFSDQDFMGLKKLTLNNMVQDPSMLNETLGYEIFRSYNIPAPRTGYASVRINDGARGLYLNLEVMDDVAMSWWMPDMAHVYESQWPGSNPDLVLDKADSHFQIDEGDDNRNDLYSLLRTLEWDSKNRAKVEAVLDVEKAAQFMAIEKYISHWDGYSGVENFTPNNFYIASNRTGKFVLIPWGMDQILGRGDEADRRNLTLSEGNGALFKLCQSNAWDYCRSTYRRTLAELSSRVETLELGTKAQSLFNDLASRRVVNQQKSTEEINSAYNTLISYIAGRRTTVSEYLESVVNPSVRWPGQTVLRSGQRVTAEMLNAYSDVPGSFKYSVKVGQALPKGIARVSVTFTPTDSSLDKSTMSRKFVVK
jgi:hypothetical protein